MIVAELELVQALGSTVGASWSPLGLELAYTSTAVRG